MCKLRATWLLFGLCLASLRYKLQACSAHGWHVQTSAPLLDCMKRLCCTGRYVCANFPFGMWALQRYCAGKAQRPDHSDVVAFAFLFQSCAFAQEQIAPPPKQNKKHTRIYIYIYICMYMDVCSIFGSTKTSKKQQNIYMYI